MKRAMGTAAGAGARAMMSTMMACDEALMDQDTWLSGFLTSSPEIALDGETIVGTSHGVPRPKQTQEQGRESSRAAGRRGRKEDASKRSMGEQFEGLVGGQTAGERRETCQIVSRRDGSFAFVER